MSIPLRATNVIIKRSVAVLLAAGVVLGGTPIVDDAAAGPKTKTSGSTYLADGRKN